MNKSQKTVLTGVACGVTTNAILICLLYQFLPEINLQDNLADRLSFTLQNLIFPVFLFFIMLAHIGNSRFTSEAINPLANAETDQIKIDGKVANNTLEQTFAFVIATLTLSTVLEIHQLKIITALTITFIIARIAFWIGYRKNPLYRAPGMAATSYMILGIFFYTFYQLLS
ncbi:MAG: MAPEG family protein [Patescibacteria group bacterium]